MSTKPGGSTTRRRILRAGAAIALAGRAGLDARSTQAAPEQDTARDRADENEGAGETGASFLLKSQSLPEPRVILPTDSLAPPRGRKLRIAAITTAYFRYSHADDIITKFIEGYAIVGRTHQPHAEVVSLAIEQFPSSDIGRGLAARYGIPLCDTPAAALGVNGRGDALAVDGVLLVGEHGDYPFNAKGQHLYPRRRLFEEIVKVFRRSGRSVPVYNDKHFSYDWPSALWMYDQSRSLGFPMMAGSSVPVAWRRPPLAFRPGIELEGALALGFSGLEVYGFHTLELLQTFVERRRGGEVGIRAVQCLEGRAAWEAGRQGAWRVDLVREALGRVPRLRSGDVPRDLESADPGAVVFLVEYSDGFAAAAYLSRGLAAEFGFAAAVRGRSEPVGTWCELNKPQRDHFSFLCNHIEVMFRTGRPSYPVERTLLVTGALAALVDSHAAGGRRIATPHLATLGYTPAPELTFPA
jgi:hypothetical protein